jgi:hypothetical protein
MSDTQSRRERSVVLVAVFSWATGVLTGVLLSRLYGVVREPKVLQTERAIPSPVPWPSPSPDCPARKVWSTCYPIPMSEDDTDKALMKSDAVGWIDVTASNAWTVKVDGVHYGWIPPWRRRPIIPGPHAVDLFDYNGMRHARCPVEILAGRRVQVVIGTAGKCISMEVPLEAPTEGQP